jgi:uncharacterized membrane protein YfcA
MDPVFALLAGSFVGAVLGLVGAGGAMLTVPILLYIFHFTPVQATTASLAVVFLAAFAGVIPKWRKGEVLPREALAVWGLGLVTNLGGSILAKHIAPNLITSGFAGVMLLAGISMLRGPIADRAEKKIPITVLIFISLLIGALTGLFGVGGGFLAIPILVRFFHTPQGKAAGTSLLIIALNCSTSFLGHHGIWSQIHWSIPIYIGTTAVLVSIFASHHSSKLSPHLLRRSLAGLLFTLTVFTLLKTWLLN